MRKTDFINNIVLGCIRSDLIRMKDSIRPDSSKKGNNNFSLALCVISYMEYLGGFLLGADKKFKDNVFNIVLDAETLANDFIDSLEVFINKLKTFKYEKRMKIAFSEINGFENKYDDFINKLENQSGDDRVI